MNWNCLMTKTMLKTKWISPLDQVSKILVVFVSTDFVFLSSKLEVRVNWKYLLAKTMMTMTKTKWKSPLNLVILFGFVIFF